MKPAAHIEHGRSAIVKPNTLVLGTVHSICYRKSASGLAQAVEVIHHDRREWIYTQPIKLNIGSLIRFDPADGLITALPTWVPIDTLDALYRSAVNPADLDRLLWLIEGIGQPDLHRFMVDMLQTPSLATAWIRMPASCRHHHSEPGGLLRHTVECAEWVQQWASLLPEAEASLTLVATLCHDLGKIRTLSLSNQISDTGQWVSHEMMGLQLLQPFLDQLRLRWAIGADALMHMLSWFPSKQEPLPRLPGLVMLKHADQLSTVMDLRARAFKGYAPRVFWRKPESTSKQRFHQVV